MHPSPHRRLLPALALLALALACGDDRDARLGASGELCQKDADCREELVCERSVCIALSDVGANNTPSNNPVNNNPSNNPTSIEEGCESLCDRFSSCGLELDGDCPKQCSAELGRLGQDGFNDFYTCAFEQSCEGILNGALERCFGFDEPGNNSSPPLPDDRYASCDLLASYAPEVCDDDTSVRLYEDCILYAAPNLGDGPFYRGISCLDSARGCDQLVECVYDAWY